MKNEMIFKETPLRTLKMLNIDNALEAMEYEINFVDSRIRAMESEEKHMLDDILGRVTELIEIEDEMIEEGRIPEERRHPKEKKLCLDEDLDRSYAIAKRVIKKCRELIVFNTERDDQHQLDLSVKEYQKALTIVNRMDILKDLDFGKSNEFSNEICKNRQ